MEKKAIIFLAATLMFAAFGCGAIRKTARKTAAESELSEQERRILRERQQQAERLRVARETEQKRQKAASKKIASIKLSDNALSDFLYDLYNKTNTLMEGGEKIAAVENLELALALQPQDAALLIAKGHTLNELGETERAILSYEASIAADSMSFDAYFNLVVVYYNLGVAFNEKQNYARTRADYDFYRELSDYEFYKSIAYFEKAHQLNPAEIATLETLRPLYFRLKHKYPELETKYDEVQTKIETLRR